MPIRFACPHCHQRLSVSTRKAGTAADCPRCKRNLTIPQPPPEPVAVNQKDAAHESAESFLVAEQVTGAASEAPPRVVDVYAATTDGHESLPAIKPDGVAVIFTPDRHDFAGLELVYDNAADNAEPAPPSVQADSIVVPRYVIYAQGGLLAAVALTAFVMGVLMGGTFVAKPVSTASARECIVTGSVTYTAGPRSRPDRGAVIVLIPVSAEAAGERAQVAGLRPSDPPPEADHKGLGVIRQLGGSYIRADANGRFESRLPALGRYWLLVISHEKRSGLASDTADVRKLSRYFDNAADLLEDRRYQLTQEAIRSDRQLSIAFD